ncbi:aspartate/glutamate racemase family protein [Pseudomonas sp. MS19]|uniref:maleate cis-trans isomerase family protein n=1 Tax=Pseudomonas sp. MS19 TaxID=2579939 RepID=UPI001562DD1C|nr:aspartate/glutamate racemase family protein [Pseudomonas sp. MS19]NRH28774.1 Asp/Glu/hydantoin racemase [Pseudomonas sp. MS19]
MTKRIRLGVLTPSSNTALEPITSAMVAQVPGVTAHFSRFTVTEISLAEQALGQFDDSKILAAAKLLADAHVDVIGWSGTAAGWLGFEHDRNLCRRITEATGIPATTSVLALNEILQRTGREDFALVSPYTADVQQRIISNYTSAGFACKDESHLNISVNFDFAEVDAQTLTRQVMDMAKTNPAAILTYCTNLQATPLVKEWEAELGIAVIDTTATVVWKMLRMCGIDTTTINGWGRFFAEAK